MINALRPCTERGCLTTMASAVNTQHSANANSVTRPSAASTASGSVPNRNPRITPSTSMISPDVRYRTRSAAMAPTSGADRPIGRLRNRSKIPVLRSSASATPVPADAKTKVCTSTPGRANCRYVCVSPEIAPPNT